MSERFDYPIDVVQDPDGGFVVTLPDFEEGVTQGETMEEVLAQASDLLDEVVACRMEDGQEIPLASDASGRPVVSLCPRTSAKVSVYRAMRNLGMSKAELGRRLGWHMPQVMRLFNVRYKTQLDQLEAALAVFGKRMSVTIQDERDRATTSRDEHGGAGPQTGARSATHSA
jgi:antitoxin HicB